MSTTYLKQQNDSQYKYQSFPTLDSKTQQETVRNCRFNVPFGYRNAQNQFVAFLNIDVDEHGEYFLVDHGNKIPIATIIAKQKKVPVSSWMDHVVVVNQAGRTTPLKKLQVRVLKSFKKTDE
jgi:hypothetical protein